MTNLGDPYTPAEALINRIFDRLEQRIRSAIMSEADDAVKAATAQLGKAKGEILAEVADLESKGVSPESLAGLKGIAQEFDDLNPDPAPEPEPVPDAGGDGDQEPAPEPADGP